MAVGLWRALSLLLLLTHQSLQASFKRDEDDFEKKVVKPDGKDSPLDFHRLDKRTSYLDEIEELMDKQLTKADPFLDDFVPDEFTGGFAIGYGTVPGPVLYQRVPSISIVTKHPYRKRVPRDVDSNVVDEIDISEDEAGQADDDVGDATIDPRANEILPIVDNIDEPAEKRDDDTTTEDRILVIRNNVTMNMVLEEIEGTSEATTAAPTKGAEASSTGTSPATIPTTSPGPSSDSSSSSSNSDSIRWLREQINSLWGRDGLSPDDRRLLMLFNHTLSSAEGGNSGNAGDSRQLLDLTVQLIMLTQRLDSKQQEEAKPEEEEEKVVTTESAVESDESEEEEEVTEESEVKDTNQGCKNLQSLKILPEDSEKEVQKKYAQSMKCYMDENVDPCQDFYRFACGRWGEYHPIPKDRSGYDTFEILREDLHANLISMFEEPPAEEDSNITAAAKTLYASCMGTDVIESRQEAPLIQLLDDLGGWPVLDGEEWQGETNYSWIDAIRRLRMHNNDVLVAIWVGPDGKDSDNYIVQSDLLLPSSDYYKLGFGHPIMQTYYNLVVDVATILGAEPARAKREMKQLIDFETELASIMTPAMMRRNFSEIYTKMSLEGLQGRVPSFNFSFYMQPLLPRELDQTEDVVIYALPYFQKLVKLIDRTDKRTVSNYVLWRFIRNRIINLDARFERSLHALYRMLYGREETPPRRKFCVAYVSGNLGNIVGSMFVKRHFDRQSKKDMEQLTYEVQDEFRGLVLEGEWLSNATKRLAEIKIDNIVHNIGYPDDIVDEEVLAEEITGITYEEDKFFENVLSNLRARTVREMSQLDDQVNRTLWTTTPAVVNAYYSRNRNQIMFPAAILQPPFYHKHFPKALNYGGIGIVIGHEITHGFDDKGRQFDHLGNIKQWWDLASFQNFRDRKRCIIDQYSQYEVEDVGIFLNGENTQGENIADNGGIKQAYNAYQNWLESNNLLGESPLPGLESFSGDQLFFLNFAQVWCGHTRPEALRSKLKTALHPPGPYRVLGTLSNSPEFAAAFNCPAGARMNPEQKCQVW